MDHTFDHVLKDGTTVHVRTIRPDDGERLLGMWARTSAESRRLRFHGPFNLDEHNVRRFIDLDPALQFAVVATRGRGEHERIVAVARYERDPDHPEQAEFAALVQDDLQGKGVGTVLVRQVALAAEAAGITHLSGDILADNVRMLNLVRELGLEYTSGNDMGVVRSDLDTQVTDHFLDVVDAEERRAAQAALGRFFRPEKVAIVGASRDRTSIGGLLLDNVLQGGFEGVVYPVNPNARYVQSVAAYPSLRACPEVPDLVVVAVPGPLVAEVVDEAGELGVSAVCVISAGFAEMGGEGVARQQHLLDTASNHGLRLVGPNCMGLMNGNAAVRLNATFSTTFPSPGRVSMSSQSGALGLAVLEHVHARELGIASFVSVGNKVDISGNDLLLYWEDDPDTEVCVMYLESFGNPRRFSRIARRISRRKPIVVVKSGRTSSGARAASSHTAAIGTGDTAVEALFEQTGVIRTDTLEEMFDVATLLSSQGLPRGRKVGVLTNAGGPAILAADALESNGLEVPRLSDRTVAQLAEFLPAEAGINNPVDMIASASPASYGRALEILGHADEIDMVFVIYIPTAQTTVDSVAQALVEAAAGLPDDVPVVSVVMSTSGIPAPLTRAHIPTFAFPEAAARAMGRVARYATWRRQTLGTPIEPDGIDRAGARAVVDRALASTGREDGAVWLPAGQAASLLGAYGIPLARAEVATTAEAAAGIAAELQGPVAVKVAAPIHKADVGGVRLGLHGAEEVRAAVADMRDQLIGQGLGHHADAFLIQEMVDEGVEMVVGVTHDPSFGPIVVTGAGGTLVELLKDVSVRITPLTDRDVDGMLSSLRMAPLLSGYRGSPPADIDALKDLLHRVNAMVEDIPEVAELDLNPVFVRPEGQGVVAVDVRLKLAPVPA
ncbi:MAG: GNAT family N-acetyltransferase [Nitriliruptoraceae bacterium]|nr:GNAT family N-acetyltransferase [Nitriliruptoraceae bacterium]